MKIQARAKLNLTLDVLGRRPDGYHEMRMIMQSVELADTLDLAFNNTGELRVSTNLHFLPNNEKNLAAQAALRWWAAQGEPPRGLDITIDKHIPVCAGMAGGSSDAAAVLQALNVIEDRRRSPEMVARVGELVGSDVPYCVLGGTALAEGRGEIITPLPSLPKCWVVLCKPEFSISTPALFAKIDSVKLRCRPDTQGAIAALEAGDLAGVARRMYNVFEDALPERQHARVNDIKNALIQCGALGASMSGTGPTAFGLFSNESLAQEAQERLLEFSGDVFLTRTV
ncbi:4-(cytidine 5'-diphospho)-2-C-methyl-D-erythritol kinase [Flintibacter muris]|uniref:4-(cytidine 5'-diphospho)-2-C-methyl-D-erythritol kinase n=1 Tax=Flintibacter muris TaxID=2941327 RepID=UPI002040F4BF|nr:4-(cytidine 5'-diphospho)-2-C-methyl-D-erythritol kinase [Flintibacter muris]